jgi:2-C-methyl-D-erythritol 4-phosphate cytidylyltransferase
MLAHAVHGVIRAGVAAQICVAIPPDDAELAAICQHLGAEAATAGLLFTVVAGGAQRSSSVNAALAGIAGGVTTVMIHDAARPLTPSGVFHRVEAALRDGAKAVIPALAVTDTVKTVVPAGLPATGAGVEKVVDTPPRGQLRAVQTPQGFDLATLRRAHEHVMTLDAAAAARVTDDAMLVEALGDEVFVVQGSTHSFKVTTPMDLLLAEAMLAGPLRPRWIEG